MSNIAGLSPFVEDGRLIKVPAKQWRRHVILQHIVFESFQTGRTYDELEVNDRLRGWCDGGEVDHVTIRRYLIDMKLLHRANGLYWVDLSSPPEPNIAERTVTALGLD